MSQSLPYLPGKDQRSTIVHLEVRVLLPPLTGVVREGIAPAQLGTQGGGIDLAD